MTPSEASQPVTQGGSRSPDVSWASDVRPTEVGGFWRDLFGVAIDRRTWGALVYMLTALGTGTAYFALVATGLSLGAGLIILVVGVPLLVALLGVVRGVSLVESRLVEALLGTQIVGDGHTEPRGEGFVPRMRFWFRDRRTWTGMAYMLLQLPLGIAYFTVAVAGFAGGAWLMVLPFLQWIGGHTYLHYGRGLPEVLFLPWQLPLLFVAGVLVLLAWMHIVRGLGRLHAGYAAAMLGSGPART